MEEQLKNEWEKLQRNYATLKEYSAELLRVAKEIRVGQREELERLNREIEAIDLEKSQFNQL